MFDKERLLPASLSKSSCSIGHCSMTSSSIYDASETTVLKQKLQSKAEALFILTQELEKVRRESEEYKELIHKLQSQYSEIKLNESLFNNGGFNSLTFRDQALGQSLNVLREDNKRLLAERENLQVILKEKEEEVQLIRKQRSRDRKENEEKERRRKHRQQRESDEVNQCRLLEELESLQIKYSALKKDLQSVFDEKEDLINERDAYKGKVHRLNHALNALLKSDGYKTLDLDCLLSENRYLQQRLDQAQEEKDLANEMGRRYKSALEKNRGLSEPEREKELKRLVQRTSFPCPQNLDFNDIKSMYELCHSLLETLNDRMTQLKTQRRANKHLVERLTQLEEKLYSKENGELLLWPSHYLMKGYNPAEASKGDFMDGGDEDVSPELEELFERFQEISALTASSEDPTQTTLSRPSAPIPILEGEEDNEDIEDEALPPHLRLMVEEAMNNLNDAQ